MMNNLKNDKFSEGKSNPIENLLKTGTFFVTFEIESPLHSEEESIQLKNASEIIKVLENQKKIPSGIAVLDKSHEPSQFNTVDFANKLFTKNKLNFLYLSGKAVKSSQIKRNLSKCKEYGISNIIPVTGNAYDFSKFKHLKKPACFDSIHTLHIIKNEFQNSGFFPGAIVNPFKYESDNSFAQYFKLIKKLNFGANFIVAQSGWDMMKYQELRWYMNERDYNYPTIARFTFLTPEKVLEIQNNKCPGIFISRDLGIMLDKEKKFGYAQFESVQWRRLQIIASGLKLLGYGGIQISGLQSPKQADIALQKLNEAFIELNDFEKWRQAYTEHFSRSDMAPFAHRHYLYKNLFSEQYTNHKIKEKNGINKCKIAIKTKYKIAKHLFSKSHLLAPNENKFFKTILLNCPSCAYCRIPLTHYICPETCPKGLANGPCGNSSVDGFCEINPQKTCIHLLRVRIAAWLNQIDLLEERYIRHPDQGEKSKI